VFYVYERTQEPWLLELAGKLREQGVDYQALYRTDDITVHRYRLFLRKAAPPPPEDDLAKAFRAFLPLSVSFGPKGAVGRLAGKYQAFRRPYQNGADGGEEGKLIGRLQRFARFMPGPSHGNGFVPACLNFNLERSGETGFLRVSETIDERMDEEAGATSPAKAMFGSNGFILPCARREFFMMTRGFGETRLYLLHMISEDPAVLRGLVFEAQDMLDLRRNNETAWNPSFEIVLGRRTNAKSQAPSTSA
jgi:hypothetical protein